jgi:hypothetical protein
LLLGIAVAHAETSPDEWSKRIISKTKKPLISWLNPHVSEINVLVIDGKRFEHVRGLSKFYLPVPQIGAIVFVTDEKDYSVTYHVFKMDKDQDVAIHAKGSMFGRDIGSAQSQDSIVEADNQHIVLMNLNKGARSTLPSLANLDSIKELYFLDLDRKSVSKRTLYLDKDGKTIMERNSPARPD